MKCETCRFYEAVPEVLHHILEDGADGLCRRNPPQLMFNGKDSEFSSFPTVVGNIDWCGEWRAKG